MDSTEKKRHLRFIPPFIRWFLLWTIIYVFLLFFRTNHYSYRLIQVYVIFLTNCYIFLYFIIARFQKFSNRILHTLFLAAATALFSFFVVFLPFVNQPRVLIGRFWQTIGFVLIIFGAFLRNYSILYFCKSGGNLDLVVPKKLATGGPYRLICHPQYLGSMLFFTGWSLLWKGLWCFYLSFLFIVGLVLHAFIEEKHILEKVFGEEYRAYKRKIDVFLEVGKTNRT